VGASRRHSDTFLPSAAHRVNDARDICPSYHHQHQSAAGLRQLTAGEKRPVASFTAAAAAAAAAQK